MTPLFLTATRDLTMLACLALALAACVREPPPATADQASQRACRVRAEQIYAQQSRGTPSVPNFSDAPFAAGGLPSDTTSGLSARYDYDNILQSCLRGSEANTELGAGQARAAAPQASTLRPPGSPPLAAPAPGAPLSAPPP